MKRWSRGAAVLAVLAVCGGAAGIHHAAVRGGRDMPSAALGSSLNASGDLSSDSGESTVVSPGIRVLASETVFAKNGVVGEEICFSTEEIARVLGYTPTEITLCSLPDPTVGVLKLGTMPLAAGARLSVTVLPGLRFAGTDPTAPAACSFSFTASSPACTTDTPLTCQLYLLACENGAPLVSDVSVVTYEDVPVSAALTAADPESDDMVFQILSAPKKGTVSFDTVGGGFTYTPDAGAHGRDSFTYCVCDRYGNYSEASRATLEIRRAEEEWYYSDLAGHPCAAAAMYLTEEGIFRGANVGGYAVFSPDTPMTRVEFLLCAMRAAGMMLDDAATAEDILALAVSRGILLGDDGETDGGARSGIRPEAIITRAEAAVLLQRLFDIDTQGIMPGTMPGVVSVFSEEEISTVPVWSVDAVSCLTAAGILPPGDANAALDRGMCAMLLAGARGWE